VFIVVRQKVIEREAVVTGDEIYALFGLALLVSIDFGTSQKAVGDSGNGSGFAAEKAAEIIPEPVILFHSTVADETADLVKAGCIPGFCNKLGSGKDWVRLDIPEHRWTRHAVS